MLNIAHINQPEIQELESRVDHALENSDQYSKQELVDLKFEAKGAGITLRKYEQLKALT